MSDLGERRLSIRSRILAWTCYAAIGYVGLTVTVVGLTLDQLAPMVGLAHAVELRQIFLGRGMGAVTGSLVSGWVCDRFSIKRVVTLLILAEAVLLALVVPSMTTLDSLTAAFFAVGVVGSSLVVCATTSACWAFPGALVGPVMSAASASFGIASALLPLLLRPFAHSLRLQYCACAAGSIPALLLLWLSDMPRRPRPRKAERPAERSENEWSAGSADRGSLALTLAAALVQVLLQGGLSSLMGWIVSFGRLQWDATNSASVLISTLQGASTAGCVAAAYLQGRLDLLVLLPVQLAIATIGMLVCVAFASSTLAGFAAIGWYGFFAGPTVGYCSSLLNTYVTLTGVRMSIVSLGINAGANLVPWGIGCLMSRWFDFVFVCLSCPCNCRPLHYIV
mmetsp:Transcript_22857/g.53026  ORF Transcript_22857/g.53026 Transcript_22857/m.53026 type:complete len:394 (+) Transcript_22857:80-1261(+)